MRVKVLLYVAVAGAICVGPAHAGVGSVISSFRITDSTSPLATGVFRDGSYVYGVLSTSGDDYFATYTPAGSLVGSFPLTGADEARDADHSTLGSGYVAIFDFGNKKLLTYSYAGNLVDEKPLPSDTLSYAYVPGDNRYYVGRGSQVFRYTLNDVLVNQFYVGGTLAGLAATSIYDGVPGNYVIAGRSGAGGYTFVYSGAGSAVDSFVVPGSGTFASVCGPAAFFDTETTYWSVQSISTERWAFQVDVDGGYPAVAPSSLGKVRAIFR
ncbi:MAG: hypothetical protein PVH29_04690 [Candidatus Zixiibacteriota bacterium]|jgi:hypothetical protein